MRPPRRTTAVVAAAVLALVVAVSALARSATSDRQDQWTIASPDGGLTATVAAHAGSYTLTVERNGRRVLATPLGHAGTRERRVSRATVHDAFSTPAGKRRQHVLDAEQLSLSFPRGRRIDVRLADDGVAFRQTGAPAELTAWRTPRGTRAWLQHYRTDYEGAYDPVTL